jgi:putative transposase
METKSLNHSCYQLQYHIVWGTKYRRKWLKDYVAKELELSLKTTAKKYPGLHMITLGTDQDHMHMQVEIPPTISICDAVRYFKMNSSIHLRKKFKFIRDIYLGKDGIWSVGYFVSSIGLDEERIRKYVEWQGKREMPQTQRLF